MPALDDLLRRAAAEIWRCRAAVLHLEDVVQVLVEAQTGSQGTARAMRELQAIDLLDQRLRDLACWTEAVAASVPGCRTDSHPEELARVVLLSEMRRALGGQEEGSHLATGHSEVF